MALIDFINRGLWLTNHEKEAAKEKLKKTK